MGRLQWDLITSEERIPSRKTKEAHRYRSEIESDYHRIIRSASYRRLQDKTQVFPLDHSDFVRTRTDTFYGSQLSSKINGKTSV